MALTLEDMDSIIGYTPLDTTGHGAIAPSYRHQLSDSRKRANRATNNDETESGDAHPSIDDNAQATKRRRAMTTGEKVQQFLLGGQWNALLPPDESALSSEFSERVSKAAETMGLPERRPDTPAADADHDEPAPLAKQPTYKSIDNLLCLAVAAPAHSGQQYQPAGAAPVPAPAGGLKGTSKASFCRTPTPTTFASAASPSALGSASPAALPALKSPAQAALPPNLPLAMDMPPMIRSRSGTQLTCF